jgi:papilin
MINAQMHFTLLHKTLPIEIYRHNFFSTIMLKRFANFPIGIVHPQPERPQHRPDGDCERYIRHCESLRCPYGILKSYDGECERCECEDPCASFDCPIDSKCSVDLRDQDGESVFVAVCRQFKKPGQCPRLEQQTSQCETECRDDADCRGDAKCCSAGCSQLCTSPIQVRETTRAPYHREEAREPVLEDVDEDLLRPVAREGGVATLKCFATGFPPPSITWKRGGIEVSAGNSLNVTFIS